MCIPESALQKAVVAFPSFFLTTLKKACAKKTASGYPLQSFAPFASLYKPGTAQKDFRYYP